MIKIRNISTVGGKTVDHVIESPQKREIDGSSLLLMPALIDPHVHFRIPGLEHKENWKTAAKAAIRGGITTVFDMPNTLPPCISLERLKEKKERIDAQLREVNIPLHYHLYLGADKSHFDEIFKCKKQVIGLKVFMGSSTGDLVMDDDSSLHAAFSLAAAHGLVLAVHAEDEDLILKRKKLFEKETHPRIHSEIRNREVAILATTKAIELAKIYRTQLYLLHISTKEEVELIRRAKKDGISVFAETTPHHLFLTVEAYEALGTKVQMNPPIRNHEDCQALWKALHDGTIDTIGSDHAPHTLEEKKQPYGKAPSGIPGVETTLPLLLDAFHQKKISLDLIVRLMRHNVEKIFSLPTNQDVVLIDLNKVKEVKDSDLCTLCRWSPYSGRSLKGWPVYTILKGNVYDFT
jgi:dihydroorotase